MISQASERFWLHYVGSQEPGALPFRPGLAKGGSESLPSLGGLGFLLSAHPPLKTCPERSRMGVGFLMSSRCVGLMRWRLRRPRAAPVHRGYHLPSAVAGSGRKSECWLGTTISKASPTLREEVRSHAATTSPHRARTAGPSARTKVVGRDDNSRGVPACGDETRKPSDSSLGRLVS
jgi:hypothetical protein